MERQLACTACLVGWMEFWVPEQQLAHWLLTCSMSAQ